ncbi:hypothetical protein SISSUDRAFT_1128665 [Sistotremastrum suecicum HHB10207 ss-3]|uniref:Velvet domain-containing protein n=1 Tax=Sistotremastrum suecicum HHB10207 ss-3 TaxID=1314776 RepID=A0A166DJ40_9AGAM|nr:hypothetical protein SISSUDRAFT_1128665 [Sistotremastrum suecicum HHB10207 ss-3]
MPPSAHYQSALTRDEQIAANQATQPTFDYINEHIAFNDGPFAGRIVRAELIEKQKPDLGRKFAKRDRRPLDPPPVAQARFFELKTNQETGEQHEEELMEEDIPEAGLICFVDLFPWNDGSEPPFRPLDRSSPEGIQADSSNNAYPSTSIANPMSYNAGYSSDPPPPRVSPPEDTKLAGELFGSRYIQAIKITDSGSGMNILFPFPDISVQIEGRFFLRYRMFLLPSIPSISLDVPIMAEALGSPFTVYSTKEFPGLKASTPLTKKFLKSRLFLRQLLSAFGIKVNSREAERRRTPRRRSGKGGRDDDDSSGQEGGHMSTSP